MEAKNLHGGITTGEALTAASKLYDIQFNKELKDSEDKERENFDKVCTTLREIYIKKNKEYGDSFAIVLERLGMVASLVSIMHKVARLENIIMSDAETEATRDTLQDLANYCIMTLKIMDEVE